MNRLLWTIVLVANVWHINHAFSLSLPYEPSTPLPRLGYGVDARNLVFRNKCFEGIYSYAGVTQSQISFDKTLDQSTIESQSKISLSGKVNLFVASAKLTGSLSRVLSESKTSIKLIWGRSVKGKTVVLSQPSLTDDGKRALESGDPDFISLLCGDGVISEIELGANLYITAEIDFASEQMKEEMSAKIKWKVLGFGKSKTIRDSNEWNNENSTIRFDGFQIGGNPRILEGILASANQLKCSLANMEPCHEVIDRLQEYTSGNSGLTAQLNNLEYNDEGSYAPLFYKVKSFSQVGFPQLDTPNRVDDLVQRAALDRFESEYESYHDLYTKLKKVIESNRLLSSELSKANDVLNKLEENLATIEQSKIKCLKFSSTCDDEISLNEIKRDLIDIGDRMSDYCRWDKLGVLSDSDQVIMDAVYAIVNDDCETINRKVSRIEKLNLSGKKINDIRPLKYLSGLKYLDLSKNEIKSVSSLVRLRSLETLNLKNNEIRNISPIGTLRSLNALDASYNVIDDVSRLSQQSLKTIRVHGNPLRILGSLSDNRTQYDQLTLNEFDACEVERKYALSLGYDEVLVEDYRSFDFSPVYKDFTNPSSGISTWGLCALSVKNYEWKK